MLHFEPRFIGRTFQKTIKREVVEIPQDRPQLAKDAVPTIFPNAPHYITKSPLKKRKERNICDQVFPAPKRSRQNITEIPPSTIHDLETQVSSIEAMEGKKVLSFLGLKTSQGWSEIHLLSSRDYFLYAEHEEHQKEVKGSPVLSCTAKMKIKKGRPTN